MAFNVQELAAQISETAPTGEDVRSGARVELYYRPKDARSAACSEERNIDPGETFRLSPAWSDVRSIACEILQSISKDVEVLSRLCEAELRLRRFAGLKRCFQLAAQLADEDFTPLHSIDGDGVEGKVSPLAGLNGGGGESTLIQPLRLSPLVPGAAFFRYTLWDYQTGQRPGEAERLKTLQDAMHEAGPAAMRAPSRRGDGLPLGAEGLREWGTMNGRRVPFTFDRRRSPSITPRSDRKRRYDIAPKARHRQCLRRPLREILG